MALPSRGRKLFFLLPFFALLPASPPIPPSFAQFRTVRPPVLGAEGEEKKRSLGGRGEGEDDAVIRLQDRQGSELGLGRFRSRLFGGGKKEKEKDGGE